jgi:hypothetical protein
MKPFVQLRYPRVLRTSDLSSNAYPTLFIQPFPMDLIVEDK